MVAVLTLVLAFRSSTALAFAFGMAVTGTITITTLLFFYIVRHQWRQAAVARRRSAPAPAHRRPALLRREPDQAHPRRLAAAADRASPSFTVLTTWQRGRELGHPSRANATEGSLRDVRRRAARHDPPLPACPGTAVFLNRGKDDRAAGDARQRRAQPRPARARRDPLDRDAARAARRRRRADRGRRPRLHRRRDHPRHRPLRLHGRAERARPAAADPRGRLETPLDDENCPTSSHTSSWPSATHPA